MSDSNHANYFLAGLTVIAAAAAIAAALVYIGGVRGRGDKILVETYYDKPISGLSVGSDVNFRGVKIGEVREVSFVGAKYEVNGIDRFKIYILMAIERGSLGVSGGRRAGELCGEMVERGLRATVSASGITGLSRVECNFSPNAVPMPISWTPRHPYIPSKPSLLESFSDSATKAMNQLNRMDFASVWSNVNVTVSSAASAIGMLETLISSRQREFSEFMRNIEEASSSLRDFADAVKRNPSLLLSGGNPRPLEETSGRRD